ncbi:MAG: sugar phosphate isomerase/epimerase [Terriglobia bacterium]|jgi:sugar phosphate isomerase/epimerase
MKLGIFARIFRRPSLDEVLACVRAHGLTAVQFNLSCAGLDSLPEVLEPSICREIHTAFKRYGLEMVAVSGTFNAIHPDFATRTAGIRRCCQLIRQASLLGTTTVSLCTGTRDPWDPWRFHPDNSQPAAWHDLLATLDLLLRVAQENQIILGIEPEVTNVVDSARQARRLLDECQSRYLKIIFDGANLFHGDNLVRMKDVLEEAFDLLGRDVVIVHAKDIQAGDPTQRQPAGTGALDYDTYFRLLKHNGFDGPVVLHNLDETEVDSSVKFVRQRAARWYPELTGGA